MMSTLRSLLWMFGVCVFCAGADSGKRKEFKEFTEAQSMKKRSPHWDKIAKGSKPGMPAGFGLQPQIVGGTPVPGSEYPYIASLYIADPNCGIGVRIPHFCGGSIFDTETRNLTWLLTAAHCAAIVQGGIDTYNEMYSNCNFGFYADIGRDDADDPNESGFATIRFEGWKMHESYDGQVTNPFDVAIAWSKDRVAIDAVNLHSQSPCCYDGDDVRVVGYGADLFQGLPTETLEYVDMKFLELPICDAMYGGSGYVQPGMVCAIDEGESACHGDSGGPLLNGTHGSQVGIVSWGNGCDAFGMPSVFADVGFHYPWIMYTRDNVVTETEEYFTCNDGCLVIWPFVDDGWCDCGECEDETNWDCDSCPGCPPFCGFYVPCVGPVFECNEGCVIPQSFVNNSWCDCTQCEDEANWDCDSCDCPLFCGDGKRCGNYSTTPAPGFHCDDGCVIPDGWENDGWCDCTQCEDEPNWTCASCPGCPTTCGSVVYCTGVTTEAPVTTQGFTTKAPTTEAPTTKGPTTKGPTTKGPTTKGPTTKGPTTKGPTTKGPTTEAPTTEAPTTEAPTTEAPICKKNSFTYSSDEADCFENIDSKIKITGWTKSIGPLAVDQSVDLYTLSGAEDCQLDDARCDGVVTATRRVDANGDFLEVAFAGNEANGVRFTKFFVWFGTSQLPLKNNGQFTVNTNAFFCKDHSPGVGSVNYSLQCRSPDEAFSYAEAFYFIAQSWATGCDQTEEGQDLCADIF